MRLASDQLFRRKLPRRIALDHSFARLPWPLGTYARPPTPAPSPRDGHVLRRHALCFGRHLSHSRRNCEYQGHRIASIKVRMALVTDALITLSPGRLFEGLDRAGAAAAHSLPR
jgi:hypothetical protein